MAERTERGPCMSKYLLLIFSLLQTNAFLIRGQESEIDLRFYEKKISSQNGEDGVLQKIFNLIGATSKYYVEFGVENGSECNTRFLRQCGWHGLMMDRDHEKKAINLRKECVTPENICELLEKYAVPNKFDLLSVDIDFNDFYVLHRLLKKYHPRVIVVEYNATHLPNEDKVVIYNAQGWDGTNYFGASIRAFHNLGVKYGYTLVYAEKMGVNLFFVCDKVIRQTQVLFKNAGDCNKLYMPSKYYCLIPNEEPQANKLNKPYISSKALLESD